MNENETINVTNTALETPEVILQKQIDILATKVKELNSDNAWLKVQLTNKEIELDSMKAVIDSQTTSNSTKKEDLTELIDENNLSEVLMSANY